jgi:hypothetical protein
MAHKPAANIAAPNGVRIVIFQVLAFAYEPNLARPAIIPHSSG